MSIELIFNSVTVQYEDILEQFPVLYSQLNEYLPSPKKRRQRRKRKQKVTLGSLIKPIIDSLEK